MTAAAKRARSVRGTRESTIKRALRITMFGRNMSRFFIRLLSSLIFVSRQWSVVSCLPDAPGPSEILVDLSNEGQASRKPCQKPDRQGGPVARDALAYARASDTNFPNRTRLPKLSDWPIS